DGIRCRNVTGVQTCALPILTIGYLGSLNERKGLDILIDSLIELNKNYNNIQLLIVGDVSPGHDDLWQEQLSKLRNKNIVFKHVRSEERRVGKECRYVR